MKNKYTFLDAAEEVLKKLNYPENSRNLWKEIEKLGLDKKIGSNGKTPWATLNAQLLEDVKRQNSRFSEDKTKSPIVYSLKNVIQNNNVVQPKPQIQTLINQNIS